jgi:hypothetical protein
MSVFRAAYTEPLLGQGYCCTKLETFFAWTHLSIGPRALHPGMFVSFVPADYTASRSAK